MHCYIYLCNMLLLQMHLHHPYRKFTVNAFLVYAWCC